MGGHNERKILVLFDNCSRRILEIYVSMGYTCRFTGPRGTGPILYFSEQGHIAKKETISQLVIYGIF